MDRFIVGTGRCGSTLLSQMLAEHPGALSVFELFNGIDMARRFAPEPISGESYGALIAAEQPFVTAVLRRGYEVAEIIYPFETRPSPPRRSAAVDPRGDAAAPRGRSGRAVRRGDDAREGSPAPARDRAPPHAVRVAAGAARQDVLARALGIVVRLPRRAGRSTSRTRASCTSTATGPRRRSRWCTTTPIACRSR